MQAQQELKATAWLAISTFAWVATLALAQFGPALWDSQPALTWTAVGINIAAGIGWIVGITHYLRTIDELQRKITQEALTVTLGVGWVAGFAYVVANDAGIIAYEVNVAVLPVLMSAAFLIAFAVGRIRYR